MSTKRSGRVSAGLTILWLAVACQPPKAPPKPEETRTAPPVHTGRVKAATRSPVAEGTAEIAAKRSATVRAEAAGRIVHVGFEVGDRVKRGASLVRLDIGRTSLSLKASTAAADQAAAQLEQRVRERELAERLAQQGSMAQRDLDRAQDAERIARAALQTARAQTGVTERGLADATVRAPFNGTVAERYVELGEYLSPGAQVALVVDAQGLEAEVLLDPRKALDVQPGAAATVTVFARGDEHFDAKVTRVGDVVDARTRKLPVEVEISDPSDRLRPGLIGRVAVEVGEPRTLLQVDDDAVFERFEQDFVYVLEGETAHRRQVQLGEVHQGQVEVLEGLAEGETVLTRGIERVADGHAVHVVEPPAQPKGRTSL